MIAVVVPAHNEEDCILQCLASLLVAARCEGLHGETVMLVVVLDACTDRTALFARRCGAVTIAVRARNVGAARAAGAKVALNAGARWLAFTDADSVVAPDWISAQLALRCDAVCGTVSVTDWNGHHARTREAHDSIYVDADGHRHVHGANLGVSAKAYRGAEGFSPLASSEDVAFVEALQRSGASIAWSAAPRVSTSARRRFRAPGGFGAFLMRLEAEAGI